MIPAMIGRRRWMQSLKGDGDTIGKMAGVKRPTIVHFPLDLWSSIVSTRGIKKKRPSNIGIVHSLGSIIHLLIGLRYAVQRNDNILTAFNDKEKYILGKQSGKEITEQPKDGSSSLSPSVAALYINENQKVKEPLRAQMGVQRRPHEQVEVQKHIKIQMEAYHNYIDSLLEKACKIASEQISSGGLNG
ncbi:hypothetical protein IEQ34_000914 [Dendrobium chrysotoxum]|uniref:MYB-CC type transcription factor LHEQLE-containing domain-containing protein n=1 Tax=Dendrobium chrysotoxum TaxID=161865 RepID=A0AAV7HL24_DENCH|nr:hypothetical protein IEQ34_000914 [Dendrobium chrysotoxum]